LSHVVLSPFRPRLAAPSVQWLPSDPLTPNRKVGHLAYALATLPREDGAVVLCIDADVEVDGALVVALVAELEAGAAVASAPPRPGAGSSLAAHAVRGLLVQSHHSFEVLDVMSLGAKAICGKALALSATAAALLPELSQHIGEDLDLAEAMHRRGLAVRMTRVPAAAPQAPGLRGSVVLDRFTRWMQVLRSHRPFLFFTVPALISPTPLVLAAALAWATTGQAWLAVLGLFASRQLLALRLDGARAWRLEWLLGEALLLLAWVGALARGPKVSWRGRQFRLGAGGVMTPEPQASTQRAPT
jgi:hypothetical protein